ncbi:MAG: hypothetical protein ACO1NM_13660 [Sphingobium phenoxybenzoativorans]
MMRLFPLALMLALAACGQQDRSNTSDSLSTTIPASEDNAGNAAVADDGNASNALDKEDSGYTGGGGGGGYTGGAAGGGSTGAAKPGAAQSRPARPSQTAVTARDILPPGFRGYWAGLNEDCGNQRSDLRLVVLPKELRFYESVGKVTAVEQAGPLAVMVGANFEGEGQNWFRWQKFTLSADEKRLTVTYQNNAVIRKRCPGTGAF